MKFILMSVIVYLFYRYFRGKLLPAGRNTHPNDHLKTTREEKEEGEYIDYEEVE